MNDAEKRRERRKTRLLQSESSWLQKALFALRKIEDVQDRIADLEDREADDYVLKVDGKKVDLGALEDALEARAQDLRVTVRERRARI